MRISFLRFVAIAIAASVFLPNYALAVTIVDRRTGLVGPDTLVDFGNGLFSDGTIITDQFAASGLTFGSNYSYLTLNANLPSIAKGFLESDSTGVAPGSIFFSADVSAAAFSWRTLPATTLFRAFLNDVLVESFSAPTNEVAPALSGRFYGFEGIVFNEIRLDISVSAQNNEFNLDNLQFNLALAVVPLPAALPLYGTGLAIMGFIGWRRKRKV